MALKDGLVKFQPYIEGEKVIAITDHAAFIWTKTFQNVNHGLLLWGTIFSAYPDLQIHCRVSGASPGPFGLDIYRREPMASTW